MVASRIEIHGESPAPLSFNDEPKTQTNKYIMLFFCSISLCVLIGIIGLYISSLMPQVAPSFRRHRFFATSTVNFSWLTSKRQSWTFTTRIHSSSTRFHTSTPSTKSTRSTRSITEYYFVSSRKASTESEPFTETTFEPDNSTTQQTTMTSELLTFEFRSTSQPPTTTPTKTSTNDQIETSTTKRRPTIQTSPFT